MSTAILAYTGSLTTTVAIHWLRNKKNMKVITYSADVGQGGDLEALAEYALHAGASSAHVVDLKYEFAKNYLMPSLFAHADYEHGYLLGQALTRPLIATAMTDCAHQEGAHYIAHGCSTKGNDQIRFESSVATVAPHLELIAPMREWNMNSHDALLDYADRYDITISEERELKHSTELCLWGSAVRLTEKLDTWKQADNSVFCMTKNNADTPAMPTVIDIGFENGIPISLDGKKMDLVSLIKELNKVAGEHGVGRIDTIENRLTGIKTREIYEAPAAYVLHAAHKGLESIVLSKDLLHFKLGLSDRYGQLVYDGLWYSELRLALDSFFQNFQQYVTGNVKIKLFHATAHVIGKRSPYSQFDVQLANTKFLDPLRNQSADAFMAIHNLPQQAEASIRKKFKNKNTK